MRAVTIKGLDTVPFDLSPSQRNYLAKVQANRDVTALRIIAHDSETKAIRIKITYWRPAWRASVDNVRRRWIHATPQARA